MKASNFRPYLAAFSLAALLALTRNHHVADLTHLPDASWAIFFAAGFYLRARWTFPSLFILAVAVDLLAITWGGVDDFCVSPAYVLLLPAYGLLFLAGRWYAARHRPAWSTLVPFLSSAFAGALACELVASGGFYLFSGRFAGQDAAGYGERFIAYFPGSLQSFAFWLGVATVARAAFTLATRRAVRVQG